MLSHKTCPHCATSIPAAARVCPRCRNPQPLEGRRRTVHIIVFSVAVLVVWLFFLWLFL